MRDISHLEYIIADSGPDGVQIQKASYPIAAFRFFGSFRMWSFQGSSHYISSLTKQIVVYQTSGWFKQE